MQTDYKSHELNLYSNDNVGRLRFVDGKGTGLGPGFGQNQEYIFAKYTDDAKGQFQWPVCIPELHTITSFPTITRSRCSIARHSNLLSVWEPYRSAIF
jgi:hypothetical protein